MNKKFLSAILFGALMVTSTGTFVSCKDYDDDIENLQGQISANASAIAELKALIGDGNYVTSISVNGQNLVVNTKNGSTTVALPACEGAGSLAEVKGNQLFIDGEATGLYGESVKIVNGEWALLQEDGTYKSTGIEVSGVSVTGNEKEGWVLTIKDAEGNAQTVNLPSAASMLTNASLGDNKTLAVKYYDAWSLDRKNNVITDTEDWKGTKTLPNAGDVVFANEAENPIDLRIDPVDVDGTGFEYTLVDTKNATLSNVVMKANEYKEYAPLGRAAYGNGLYSLTLSPYVIAKAAVADYKTHFDGHAAHAHAININGVYRTEYAAVITALEKSSKTVNDLTINNQEVTLDAKGDNDAVDGTITGIKVGTEYKVTFTDAAALYDMFFEVDEEYVNEFGITWNNETHKFKVAKNPDASTIDSNFPMNIYTIDNKGRAKKTTVEIQLAAKLSNATMYDLYTHNVSAQTNAFAVELATMKSALGEDLDKWKINVKNYTAALYAELNDNGTDVKGSSVNTTAFAYAFLNAAGDATTTSYKDAGYFYVVVNNDNAAGLKLDKKYYYKVTFTNGTEELNSMIVPVMFVAPTVAEQIEVKDGYMKDGAINAYFYKTTGTLAENKTVNVSKYFTYTAEVADANVKFDDATVVTYNGNDYATNDLIKRYRGATLADAELAFLNETYVSSLGREIGYGETLNLSIKKATYKNWTYTVEGDDTYEFSMRIMSPIKEGSIKPTEGNTIKISANDLVSGAKITDKMIMGYDYNSNTYDIVPDKVGATATALAWEDPQIASVAVSVDKKAYLKSATLTPATTVDGATVKGAIVVKGESLSKTTEVLMPVTVTDTWNYTMTQEVSVTVEVK